MKNATPATGMMVGCVLLLGASGVGAQDWPQWRGTNRDAKVTGFKAPATWPKELTKKWSIKVGEGVATPALVGDKLYVFARADGNDVLRCLNAADGKEVWQEKYETPIAPGVGGGFNKEFIGPRGSPTVSDGKVVTYGARGVLSCVDANSGKKLWRSDDFKNSLPMFSTSCSPLVVDGLCVVQLGGESKGAIVAYELANGKEKWKWDGDGSAYSSPVLLTLDGTKIVVAETASKIVGVGAADGKLHWQIPFAVGGKGGKGGRGYNTATPIVDGQTVIYTGSGRGTKAVKIEKDGDKFEVKDSWSNADNSVQFSSPVLKDGRVFGITSGDSLFCITKDGKSGWSHPLDKSGRNAGYGSVVDAGAVLVALNPSAQLVVFEPTDKEFKQLAKYKVADSETFAYPVVSGNRVFVKDKESLTLWTIE